MKGQLILEFVIAGFIFFAIVIYTINYLNVNVSDFNGKFYQNYLQTKALQISEILMGDASSLGLMDNAEFNTSKIQSFNSSYCNPGGVYKNLVEKLHLYQKTIFGTLPNDVRIEMNITSSGVTLLDCGPRIPRNITRAEIGRLGMLQDGGSEIANLRIVVW
jgi:hypothetical protein